MKKYNDDDGRTIANMDNLDQRGILSSWFGVLSPGVREDVLGGEGRKYAVEGKNKRRSGGFDFRNMGNEIELTREERWELIKYTMKYAIGIGLIFLVAFGLLIFLMFKLW